MVISLVSPWGFLKPQNMHTSLIRNRGFEALVETTKDLVLEDHTMDLTLEKLRMRNFWVVKR